MSTKALLILLNLFLILMPLSLKSEPFSSKTSDIQQEKTDEFYDLPENISKEAQKNSGFSGYDETYFWGELANMLVTLGCIIAVLIALMWIMRRMQTSRIKYANEAGIIKIIDHRALSPKTSIYLLQINQKAILIADSQTGATRLAELSINEIGDNSIQTAEGSSFKTLFERKRE